MATIRYTLDGSEPSATHGHVYTGPFEVAATTTIRAVSYGEDLVLSEIAIEVITIEEEEPEPEPDPVEDGECATSVCLTPIEVTPTCVTATAPTITCITPISPTRRCGNDRQTDECPEGTTGEILVIPANTYFSTSVAAANVLALAALAALRLLQPCVYENEEQECCDECPEGFTGEPICVTIAAGEYTSTISQEAANALAMAAACAEAAALRVLTPCEEEVEEETPGALYGWGANTAHQLGIGDDTPRRVPTLIEEDDTPSVHWTKIAVGRHHGLAIKNDGTLWSWGRNLRGQLGQGIASTSGTNDHDLWRLTQVGSDTDWMEVSVSDEISAAIKTDKTLWTCGLAQNGALGNGTTTPNVLSFTQVGTDTDWRMVAMGRQHCLAIKDDDTLWSTGRSSAGEAGRAGNVTVFTVVAGSWLTVCAGDLTSHGIKTDGTLWRIGSDISGTITQIGTDTNWASVSGGGFFNSIAALKEDQTLWTMGGNGTGECGIGNTSNVAAMTQIGSDTWANFSMSNSLSHCVGVKTDGTMWGCGGDSDGRLGQANIATSRTTLVQIGPDDNWILAAAGYTSSHATRNTLEAPPPPAGVSGVALGGWVNISGLYTTHTFDSGAFTSSNSTFSVIAGAGVLFDILRCGAGGGGGPVGGGGAGQFIKETGISLADGDYVVTVGVRGYGGGGTDTPGLNGGNTTFNGQTAIGGGGGGAHTDTGDEVGKNGASGGGGGADPAGGAGGPAGGTGSAGNNGGTGDHGASTYAGGGGGGASAVGANAAAGTAGAGGVGTSDSISGSALLYCAGGGGRGTVANGLGGSGTGGRGGAFGEFGELPGCGGGGGDPAGDGAAGTVIIRYLTPV